MSQQTDGTCAGVCAVNAQGSRHARILTLLELNFKFRIEFSIEESATIFVGGYLLQALSLYGYNLHGIVPYGSIASLYRELPSFPSP